MLIKLILNVLNKKINLFSLDEKLKNILSVLIISYVLTVKTYNENNMNSKLLKLEISSNFPYPFNNNN